MQLSSDLARRFRADGYVHLPSYFSSAEVIDLEASIEKAALLDTAENELTLEAMEFSSNVYRNSPGVRQFLASDKFVALTTTLLGPDLWLRWDQAVWKRPGAPSFPWHQDNEYSRLVAEHLQVWVALSPSHARNGGLQVAPGRHRHTYEHQTVGHHVEMASPAEPLSIDADPGDVVAFSSWLPHATPPNTSETTRLAYVAEFLALDEPDDAIAEPHLVTARDGAADGSYGSGLTGLDRR